jgi:hypothetical protein
VPFEVAFLLRGLESNFFFTVEAEVEADAAEFALPRWPFPSEDPLKPKLPGSVEVFSAMS